MQLQKLFSLLLLYTLSSTLMAQVSVTVTPGVGCNPSMTAAASGGTPPYQYFWSWGGVNSLNTGTNFLPSYPGGWLQCAVVDAVGDSAYDSQNFPVPFQVGSSSTPDECFSSNGTATATNVGGTAPYTYLWSNGQTTQTITGLTAGTYDVTVTDASGCYSTNQASTNNYVTVNPYSPISTTHSVTGSSCHNGSITINPSGGTPPYTVVWNTVPVQTGTTLSGLDPGFYTYNVQDAVGCTYSYWVNVPGVNAFPVSVSNTDETCALQNATAQVTPTGGVPPYTYLWSTGATTPSVSGLSRGVYRCTVTDANGCSSYPSANIGRIATFSMNLSTLQPTNCQPNGSATMNLTGNPTAPITYTWDGGVSGPTASGLDFGHHWAWVEDAQGCRDYASFDFYRPWNCTANLYGLVYADMDQNCAYTAGDAPVPSGVVQVNGGYASVQSGGWSTGVTSTGIYTVTHAAGQYMGPECPIGGYNVNVSALGVSYSGLDFADTLEAGIQDLRVYIVHTAVRPGFNATVYVYYENLAHAVINADLNLNVPTFLSFLSASTLPASWNPATGDMQWLMSLDPLEQGRITLTFNVPTTTALGTTFNYNAQINPTAGDYHPQDNISIVQATVTGSYDPNAKSVTPEGPNVSPDDSLLTYLIEFQNTGTDTAFTVILRDTLDAANLDLTTFRFLGTQHPCSWNITGPGILEVMYSNIMLPDSHMNEAASHGSFAYSVQFKPNLPSGTTILNRAGIYFDFNAPIITNTTETTILITGRSEPAAQGRSLTVFPNPARDEAHIRLLTPEAESVQLYIQDVHGRIVYADRIQTQAGEQDYALPVDRLAAGMYLVGARGDGWISSQKLVLE